MSFSFLEDYDERMSLSCSEAGAVYGDGRDDDEEQDVPELHSCTDDDENDELDVANDDEEDVQAMQQLTRSQQHGTLASGDLFPYGDVVTFLLDALQNIRRKPISWSMMEMIIWSFKLAGVPNVPARSKLDNLQKDMMALQELKLKKLVINGGDLYTTNIGVIIARDWPSPDIRRVLQVYPPARQDIVREGWDGAKWRSMPPDMALPMWFDRTTKKQYYTGELCRSRDNRYWIPGRWLQDGAQVIMEAHSVVFETGGIAIVSPLLQQVSTSLLEANYLDLSHAQWSWQEPSWSQGMPHKERSSEPIFVSYTRIFCDDVSGNRSKSWNRHWNVYFQHVNLERRLVAREEHVHFLCTSQHLSIPDQIGCVTALHRESYAKPIRVYDASLRQVIRLKLVPLAFVCDNPMASEINCHIGGQGGHYYWRCDVGGSDSFKTSDEGYHSLFYPGKGRTIDETREQLLKQAVVQVCGSKAELRELRAQSGVKGPGLDQQQMEELQGECTRWRNEVASRMTTSLSQKTNRREISKHVDGEVRELVRARLNDICLNSPQAILSAPITLDGFNPSIDTGIEILHTILLGAVKYVWKDTFDILSKSQPLAQSFGERLQRTNISGTNLSTIYASYIMKYANSLAGTYLWQLIQLAPFCLEGLVENQLLKVWINLGKLSGLVWFPTIRNMRQYLLDLQSMTASALDAFAEFSPKRIIDKAKLHLLVHLLEAVERFGPLIGMSTEAFESFNAVFRNASVFSNRKSPSRDIANDQARQFRLQQLLAGSFLKTDSGDWRQPGTALQSVVRNQPILKRAFGYSSPGEVLHGAVGNTKASKWVVDISTATARNAQNFAKFCEAFSSRSVYCDWAVSASGTKCSSNSWVFVDIEGRNEVGHISEIIATAQGDISGGQRYHRKMVVLDLVIPDLSQKGNNVISEAQTHPLGFQVVSTHLHFGCLRRHLKTENARKGLSRF